MNERNKGTFIGIDGGGTKTDLALCDGEMRVLRRASVEGCNPTVCGIEETFAVIGRGLDALCTAEYDVAAVFAGIAGCPDRARRKALTDYLGARFPAARVDADADIVNVIYCTDKRERCIAAICGTGSVAFAKTKEGLFRVGGWGPVFDTAGSGFDVGRDALRAALSEEDGFGEHTLLTGRIREKLGPSVFDGAASIDLRDAAAVASFAPLVFEAERAGDAVAAGILERNFSRLAFLINKAAELYDCGKDAVLAGGITREEETVRKYLLPRLAPGISLSVVRQRPVEGALARAASLVGA